LAVQRSLIGGTGEGMQDSFDVLEEKVKKAAELVKRLRKDNKHLDDQLKDSKAKLIEAEKKLAALEAQMGDAAGHAAKVDSLVAEIETLKNEQDQVRTRVARIVTLLESLD
jgi:predicted RNase H-like nuclease (RuvC/YqgF family)